jgi:hypothetical protein
MNRLKKWFRLIVGAGLMLIPDLAMACPNCYGAIADSEIAAGLRLAMLALIATTGVVGTGIVFFFSNMKKRADLFERSASVVTPDGDIVEKGDV